MRAQLEKKLAQKEKEKKEDHLRQLAQKAREERAGIRYQSTAGTIVFKTNTNFPRQLTLIHNTHAQLIHIIAWFDSIEKDDDAKERDQLRHERHKDRQRERNIARAAPDKRNRLERERERDISEQIALGLPAKTIAGGETQFDSRLFNQSRGMDTGFGDDETYNVYDK
jgi:SNW domain-containing protein 1